MTKLFKFNTELWNEEIPKYIKTGKYPEMVLILEALVDIKQHLMEIDGTLKERC